MSLAERIKMKNETMLEMVARGITPHIAYALLQARETNRQEEQERREALASNERGE